KIILQEGLVNMRTKYFEDLEKIKNMEKDLSELVYLTYDKFELYLKDENSYHLQEIMDLEHDTRRKASDIERYCYDLLALQQPVAKDLKFLQISIKIASNYKRISNHLSQAGIIVLNFPLRNKEKDFVKNFIKNQQQMINGGIDAFLDYDKDLAIKT